MEVVLASNNAGKLSELAAILAPFHLNVINQGKFHIEDAQETGLSFVENAIIKARHACRHTDLPSIADDSGLEVTALDGKPGIYSARFSGENATDEENCHLLLESLKNVKDEDRIANFRCVMVYLSHQHDPSPIVAQGSLTGHIAQAFKGQNGFGYDPIFFIPSLNKTCAQLSPNEKNTISHRAKATKKLIKKLIAKQVITH